MIENCLLCGKNIEVAIFKGEAWCSAGCMKKLAKATVINKSTGAFLKNNGSPHITVVNKARARLGMPLF